jgi:toxin ParE1/3/4
MPIVRWMRRAALDLDGISKRIAIHSPASAKKLLRKMQAKANALAGYPGMGRIGRVPGTREPVVHQSYYLVYRVDGSTVKILRVKHTSQQWP